MKDGSIAVVGMAGRFPGARTLQQLWQNLQNGTESIRTLTDAELRAAGVSEEELADPDYVRSAAVLDDVDLFDASFFGLSPRDAAIMDPQHRHFLECAWEALENAGYTPAGFAGSIGLFAGSGMNSYLIHNLLRNRQLVSTAGFFLLRQTGNDKDVLATRVSYQFDLHGPSINVQTACSTSLVAVHLACQSLLSCECDMALAGGVTIECPHGQGYLYRPGEILSRDGHCRAFDAGASGTIFSSGAGIVVLRRLVDAVRDRDTIHAIILGSAINNDGGRKVGYLAPSVDGQAEVITEALGVAEVGADSISYVETHGTGTAVGDPIEVKALTQAYRLATNRKGFCTIGSLKTNVGHLDAAAGVAGLIKSTLALENRKIPASLHFQSPNPLIDFENSPFRVNNSLLNWDTAGQPRRAGVTSLGIGGTNAHVILEEAPARPQIDRKTSDQLIILSTKSPPSLENATGQLVTFLQENPETVLADVAFTLQAGRKSFPFRRALVARSSAEAASALEASIARKLPVTPVPSSVPRLVFLFSGQGSQHVGMAKEIYEEQKVFRDSFDFSSKFLQNYIDCDLRELIYAAESEREASAKKLNQTYITQPALFAIEYSLAQLWMALGLKPQAMLGHSIGEYVAACLAGVFTLEEALETTAIRGRLMQKVNAGAMLAVPLPLDHLELPSGLSLAAVNGPEQCVVSGTFETIESFEKVLIARGIISRRLQTSHAFHSAMMDPILDEFRQHLRRLSLRSPRIPFLSNLSGTWIETEVAKDPEYWVKHLRGTVRFADCIGRFIGGGEHIFLEVGPGQTLTSLVRTQIAKGSKAVSSLPHRDDTSSANKHLLTTLGQLWTNGQTPDWKALHQGDAVGRIPLPTYPFEHQRFWVTPDELPMRPPAASPVIESSPEAQPSSSHPSPHFYKRVWKKSEIPSVAFSTPSSWLLMMDEKGLGKQIDLQLRGAGHTVVCVFPGTAYRRIGNGSYSIRPAEHSDYLALVRDLIKRNIVPQKVVHLWSIDAAQQNSLNDKLALTFFSLLYFAQALGNEDLSRIDIAVVTDRLQPVNGPVAADAVAATVLGPVKVIPREYPGLVCRTIDLDITAEGLARQAVQLITLQCSSFSDAVVALRNGVPWTERFDSTELFSETNRSKLKERGTYFITGGLGGLGLSIAKHLAQNFHARLALVSRSKIPLAEQWAELAQEHTTRPSLVSTLKALQEILALGGEVLVLQADVTQESQLRDAWTSAEQRFGRINGVLHAAGIVEDGPFLTKTRESAARVLAPKVAGTLTLEKITREKALDFFVLFSSISSVFSPEGQVDYAAANAFLDTFAEKNHPRMHAINWGLWREVGMGAKPRASHPLLDQRIVESDNEVVFSSRYRLESHWVLSEHRSREGTAVCPGTAYLEQAAGLLTRGSFDSPLQFENVFFLAPMVVGEKENREVRFRLDREDRVFRFSISSRDTAWREHATGSIQRISERAPAKKDLEGIRKRCAERTLLFDDERRTRQEAFFHFGPRWRNLRAIRLGQGEALTDLELPSNSSADVANYLVHPALLDLATGSALYLVTNYDQSASIYLPLSYRKIKVYKRFPAKMHSHIRTHAENDLSREVVNFQITLLDPDGQVLAEIEDFSMRRVNDPAATLAEAARGARAGSTPDFSDHGGHAITVEQGTEALVRILSSQIPPTLLVNAGDLPLDARRKGDSSPVSNSAIALDDVEALLASWWEELLGVQVGLDDDFFELGGQSLIVVRLFNKIKKNYDVELPLNTLFEVRTVRKLAERIRGGATLEAERPIGSSPMVAIQPNGTQPPLFVISGLGGNVIKFHRLARYLGEEQPIYGLLPRGLDGKEPFDTTVEDMAAYYVRAIRAIQPQGPYRVVGYSFGGIVAFEVAQQLAAEHGPVGLLGLFDTIEWHYMENVNRSLNPSQRLQIYKAKLGDALSSKQRFTSLQELVEGKLLAAKARILSAFGRNTFPANGASIEEVNIFAAANYKPQVYPGVVTIFRSTTRRIEDGNDQFLGWGGLAKQGVEVHHIASNHFNILQEPGVRILSEKLKQCLNRNTEESTTSVVALTGL